jgi:hypothetical protein
MPSDGRRRLFCTYFDQRYLARGVALHQSLRQHCPISRLWILCLDEMCFRVLRELALEAVSLIRLEQVEDHFPELTTAKQNRSLIEYYFTCTPCLPSYLFDREIGDEWLTYLDSDLYFYGSPEEVYAEMEGKSIAITPHRWTPDLIHMERFGIYNIGWVSFRGDMRGRVCLDWYRDQCIEWCYDRPEDGRCGDQKYLDDWPSRFPGTVVIRHPGCNLASWNVDNYEIRRDGPSFSVSGAELVCFHFHGLTFPSPRAAEYRLQLGPHHLRPSAPVRDICERYLNAVALAERQVESILSECKIQAPLRGTGLPKSLDCDVAHPG